MFPKDLRDTKEHGHENLEGSDPQPGPVMFTTLVRNFTSESNNNNNNPTRWGIKKTNFLSECKQTVQAVRQSSQPCLQF